MSNDDGERGFELLSSILAFAEDGKHARLTYGFLSNVFAGRTPSTAELDHVANAIKAGLEMSDGSKAEKRGAAILRALMRKGKGRTTKKNRSADDDYPALLYYSLQIEDKTLSPAAAKRKVAEQMHMSVRNVEHKIDAYPDAKDEVLKGYRQRNR